MKASELSGALDEARKDAFGKRGGIGLILFIVVFQLLMTPIREAAEWFTDSDTALLYLFLIYAAIIAIAVTIHLLRLKKILNRAQTFVASGAYSDAALALMKRTFWYFPQQKVEETLARVLIEWAENLIASHAWSDACDVLAAVRRNLSRGFDPDQLMIEEANCIAQLGRTNEARALLIIAQQSKNPCSRIRAAEMLNALTIPAGTPA